MHLKCSTCTWTYFTLNAVFMTTNNRMYLITTEPHVRIRYASINVKPEGGTPGICGAFDIQKNFWSKSPPWGPKIGSNQIKYPHLGEVISLKFIVVVVYILQIIDINCQAFLLIPFMLCVIQGK